MDWLQAICNWIIIIGGVFVAIKTISEWFGKPIKFFKQRNEQSFEERVTEVLNKVLPDMLRTHDLETRDKYRADRERYLQEIKCEVLKSIQQELGSVANLEQQYNGLQEQYEALAISAKDVLREKIMALYHKNKNRRQLEENEKEALEQYYKDYKAIKGNSYIDKYHKRMLVWTIIPDEYDSDND